jgi:GTP cyclohydrolase II
VILLAVMASQEVGTSPKHGDDASTPEFPALYSPRPSAPMSRTVSDFELDPHRAHPHEHSRLNQSSQADDLDENENASEDGSVPPTLVSPAFTPPSTPGSATPAHREPKCVKVDSDVDGTKKPKLMETLPEVNCIVRARIPT